MAMMRGQNVIVMGDMNDTPGTAVLKRLRGLDDIWGDLIQVAKDVPMSDRWTYTYRGEKSLLDHILLSPSLYPEFQRIPKDQRCEILDLGFSDHRGVLARVKIE